VLESGDRTIYYRGYNKRDLYENGEQMHD